MSNQPAQPQTPPHSASSASVDPDEIARFSAIAAEWWDPGGKFAPLHRFNPVRLAYIRDQLIDHFDLDGRQATPLKGLKLLDIGCGGGLLSEPMARLGATVTAADAGEANIKAASVHGSEQGLTIDYRVTSAEDLVASGAKFDVILNMEVIEHVADVPGFLAACATMLNPGGLMFVATLNRTAKAFALAIVGAEYVLGWLPRGTHNWQKFMTPPEFFRHLEGCGLKVTKQDGVTYNPFSGRWSVSRDMDVNYMMVATKEISQK
ncbi:MAG: bifunctional 2-polyprenyl-6-hydroxyphenol methylase/3-demethylubiquinol 3-O-methyltransferase UbiG [Parvibaculum sp.]